MARQRSRTPLSPILLSNPVSNSLSNSLILKICVCFILQASTDPLPTFDVSDECYFVGSYYSNTFYKGFEWPRGVTHISKGGPVILFATPTQVLSWCPYFDNEYAYSFGKSFPLFSHLFSLAQSVCVSLFFGVSRLCVCLDFAVQSDKDYGLDLGRYNTQAFTEAFFWHIAPIDWQISGATKLLVTQAEQSSYGPCLLLLLLFVVVCCCVCVYLYV